MICVRATGAHSAPVDGLAVFRFSRLEERPVFWRMRLAIRLAGAAPTVTLFADRIDAKRKTVVPMVITDGRRPAVFTGLRFGWRQNAGLDCGRNRRCRLKPAGRHRVFAPIVVAERMIYLVAFRLARMDGQFGDLLASPRGKFGRSRLSALSAPFGKLLFCRTHIRRILGSINIYVNTLTPAS